MGNDHSFQNDASGAGRSRAPRKRTWISMFAAAGILTASLTFSATPAFAAPSYPSWDDIEAAKANEASKQAEIANLAGLISSLQAVSDAAFKEAQIAGETYRQAQEAVDQATAREAALTKQADEAAARAKESRQRAGAIVAQLTRAGSGDASLDLVLGAGGSNDLLGRLSAMDKLSERNTKSYSEALTDKNQVYSLTDQAAVAKAERERLETEAQARYDDAQSASASAQAAVSAQEQQSTQLYEQLASLKNTTAQAERDFATGEAARRAEAAQPGNGGGSNPGSGGGSNPGNGGGSPGNGGGGGSNPGNGGGGDPTPPPPDGASVEAAISFAMAQVGKGYQLGGSGPNVWDCSGLTRAAYGSGIGTHSATNQYYTMQAQGRLVPFSQRQRGDLIFWGGGGDYYHVAIYLGNGRIVEAANENSGVREYFIWGMGDVASYVGRPTG
ncbi:NlpC/P60 family protein [Plantibacter sp. YIM 135347]|uniref:C40 family peptidase n=1 Tax=Plantibacter sp. YIM 135347 TaxID=3423919 RepID=UPI003D34BAF1